MGETWIDLTNTNNMTTKTTKRIRRHARVRSTISGTADRPRLAVYRSNRYLTAQLIDDVKEHTLAAVSSKGASGKTFTERATETGTAMAELAKKAGITDVVFDRGGFRYTGRVAAFADAARAGGLNF